ncbi:hypothetical protein [Psychrobacter sp. NPDC078631]|uniref:oxidoreductase n=1 Tax=Psychrobacter sp. NPDC078631 TaxID=3390666 RepID=UPI003CFF1880
MLHAFRRVFRGLTMSQLFSFLKLGQLTLDNRIIIAPMCQYSANDGAASDWHTIHVGQMSLIGAGLLILEATRSIQKAVSAMLI